MVTSPLSRFNKRNGKVHFSNRELKTNMDHIRAIGFDLFNTLITLEPSSLNEARNRLIDSLWQTGFRLDNESFLHAYRESALRSLIEARASGIETHNSSWISAALETQGYHCPPDDKRIKKVVDDYFSAFIHQCHLIPGTEEMLESLRKRYRLGLLSNFTHGPAAWKIIDEVGLKRFFHVILISGDLGYCKPNPIVFRQLTENLGVSENQILYVGDDLNCDIAGARQAGLQPVWTTFVEDQNIPSATVNPSSMHRNPDDSVPKISQWKDLLSLLDKECDFL